MKNSKNLLILLFMIWLAVLTIQQSLLAIDLQREDQRINILGIYLFIERLLPNLTPESKPAILTVEYEKSKNRSEDWDSP